LAKLSSSGQIEHRILTVRGCNVILDSDLAAIYRVTTKRLNEQLRRNSKKFPDDFAFQLTADEWDALRLQFATLNIETTSSASGTSVKYPSLRSQNATLKTGRGQHRKFLPYVFTEHGALQAANVLNSPRAVAMSVYVIRAFVKLREQLAANQAILKRLAEIDQTLLTHDAALRDIYEKLLPLLTPPPEPPRPQIGFHIKENSVPYRIKRKVPTPRPPTF
jgi:ORF6N domain-containing protein